MEVLNLRAVDLAFGDPPLLEKASLAIANRERVCLVGRNGAGKSSLLGLIAGRHAPDAGSVDIAPGSRVAELPQEVPADISGKVAAVVAGGLAEVGALLARFHELADTHGTTVDAAEIDSLTRRIEAADGWDVEHRIEQALSVLDLPGDADFRALSGGQKRRVLLARALVAGPDLLLLDEPTNHLDIAGIEWLEGYLKGYRGAVLFTTHDRSFLEALATRIVEIDRGGLTSWPGNYTNYLRRREERRAAEAAANQRQDRLLAEEEVWIRQGIKARRTRNEGRVRRLEKLRGERAGRRVEPGAARIEVQSAAASGRRVIEARGISFAYDDVPMVADFSTTIVRGDRVGIIGPNGSGKTTLINVLLGKLTPTVGEVIPGTRLEVAYFDQHRARLDDSARVQDNVADGSDFIEWDGERRHVIGYLNDFLFTAEQARAPTSNLSGGERNRLLLARLFATPSNLLVMDEPTNDLDIETLELLEELLVDYAGTLLLVSHDRAFLDNVVTSVLVMEGEGTVGEYVGGYSDWLRQRRAPGADAETGAGGTEKGVSTASPGRPRERPAKLSYKDARQLDALPAQIEALEQQIGGLHEQLSDPELYKGDGQRVAQIKQTLAATERGLEAAFERWSALEARKNEG